MAINDEKPTIHLGPPQGGELNTPEVGGYGNFVNKLIETVDDDDKANQRLLEFLKQSLERSNENQRHDLEKMIDELEKPAEKVEPESPKEIVPAGYKEMSDDEIKASQDRLRADSEEFARSKGLIEDSEPTSGVGPEITVEPVLTPVGEPLVGVAGEPIYAGAKARDKDVVEGEIIDEEEEKSVGMSKPEVIRVDAPESTPEPISTPEPVVVEPEKGTPPKTLEEQFNLRKDDADLLKKWYADRVDDLSPEMLEKVKTRLAELKEESAPKKGEGETVPKDEIELKEFLRARVARVIEKIQDPNRLSIESIEKEIMAQLGFDRETFRPANLFPKDVVSELGKSIEDIQDEVEKEIEVRCTLRAAELLELKYLQMQNPGKAAKAYLFDMQGEENSPAKAALINWGILRWLKDIPEYGDGISTGRVDKVVQTLLLMGEGDHHYLDIIRANTEDPIKRGKVDGVIRKLIERLEKNKSDKREEIDNDIKLQNDPAGKAKKLGKIVDMFLNLHDPSNQDLRDEVVELLGVYYDHDSATIGLQLFRALKEEGNYNWQHYLGSYFKYASAREATASIASVFFGSTRPYIMASLESSVASGTTRKNELPLASRIPNPKFGEQLERVALSGLRVKRTLSNGDRVGADLENALNGEFLAKIELGTDPKKIPDILTFKGVKAGDGMKDAISAVGALGGSGKERAKGGRDGEAEKLITTIKSSGEDLIGLGILTAPELDKQIRIEAYNIAWELSVDNPNNSTDLGSQTDREYFFATPAQLAKVFVRMGGQIQELQVKPGGEDRRYIIGSAQDYSQIRAYYDAVIKETIDAVRKGKQIRGIRVKGTFPSEFVNGLVQPVKGKILPTERGRALIDVNDAGEALRSRNPFYVLEYIANPGQGYS